ncbi:MAG: AMP-binding protein [Burkholderiaceae bacterium]|nr:AMP-binding protein [Burkholderiaceae bacterium]
MGLRDFTLFDVIERNAQLYGDRIAFVADGLRISHREYAVRVERVAAGLARAGLVAGERVAVLAQNCLEYVDLYGAAARLGLILVPVNWRLSADEIAYVIGDTTPKAIVAGAEYLPIIETARAEFPFVARFFSLGAATGAFGAFEELARGGSGEGAPVADIPSDSGFVVIHTAAVAGRPRGALLSHAGLLAANLQLVGRWGLSTTDVHLGALPLFHASGLGLMLAVQQAGGATVVLPRFDPPAVLEAIAAEKVTVFAEFPPMLGALLDQAAKGGDDLSSLRHLTGLDTADTIDRFETLCPSARFWAGYGQSELSGLVTIAPFRDRPGSAGVPTMLNRVRIVDDFDRPLPAGQTGEIVVRGPMVFEGYWNCEADNAFTFRNGWHHTGDMGRFDDDGYLWYGGRSPAKELIKPGGENVYPAEVEKALLEHAAVAEAVVFGVPDAQWGEAVKAVCVRRAGQGVTEVELIAFVGTRIARFKRPRHVVFSAELPKNAQGLPDRARIKREFADA